MFVGTIALNVESERLAVSSWLLGLLLFFRGIVGAWFNDG